MNLISSKDTIWFKAVLYIAGLYHILWGLSVIFFPCFWFDLGSMQHPNYKQIWQLIGLYESIFGIGFLFAASNPLRHWRVVLMSFIAKVSIVIGFLFYFINGDEPLVVFNMVLTNHLFWLLPFAVILYNAYKHVYLLDNEMIHLHKFDIAELTSFYETNHGENLSELTEKQPILLIFLRYFGCTFCCETLEMIKNIRPKIEKKGTKIILVHMHCPNIAEQELKKYGLDDLSSISDRESFLYKGFHLKRGTLLQVFGWKVWMRSIYLWFTKRNFGRKIDEADIFQMPGIFLVYKNRILKKFVHDSAADVPPYLDLASFDSLNSI